MIDSRNACLEKIIQYAESNAVGNRVFLGVKGVGKTTWFRHWFSLETRRRLAEKYKNLFVFCELDKRKTGEDLYRFLGEQIRLEIGFILDEKAEKDIEERMERINKTSKNESIRLKWYLRFVKEELKYNLILIMDHFHCMARDTEVGADQYGLLRSYASEKLVSYWIITDTDLVETHASKQLYQASFFVQTFLKHTIKPLSEQESKAIIRSFSENERIEITEEAASHVAAISGGIPQLIAMLCSMIRAGNGNLSVEDLLQNGYNHAGCKSLFAGWSSELTSEQKEILHAVACAENGLSQAGLIYKTGKMNELSDDDGRGLLHVAENNGRTTWTINSELYGYYIRSEGERFYREECEKKPVATTPISPEPAVTRIYNHYNVSIGGDYIQNQTNNSINIKNAVTGLESLHRLLQGNLMLPDKEQVMKTLNYLPFQQKVWAELSDDEQEKKLEEFASEVNSSEILSSEPLTEEQLKAFGLTRDLLNRLGPGCRKQLICGIQVYSMIQLCIDKFGLGMSESESPRGILFARAFEQHLKDHAAPAYKRIPELADWRMPTQKLIAFKECKIDRTTIGDYSSILNGNCPILAKASSRLPGGRDRNEQWWYSLANRLQDIGKLRNQCCHSGAEFNHDKLMQLIDMVFRQNSWEDVLFFDEIPELKMNQRSAMDSAISDPIDSLIGTKACFMVCRKGTNGNYKGIVNDTYEGSLPKRYARNMDAAEAKKKPIQVRIDKIQDNKYVLSPWSD